jgi:hypothetical protein
MSYTVKRLIFRAALVSTLLLLLATSAWAQSVGTKPIYRIEFKPGENSAIVEGIVTQPSGEGDMHNPGSERYSLRIKAGQKVSMEITSDNGEAIFTLSTPDYEMVETAASVKRWSGKLKFSGDYIVTVFTRKDTSRFKLRVTLR